MKYKVERCGFKYFPLCCAFPFFPLIKIDITNLERELTERFKNKNNEYKTTFVTSLFSKYWKYLLSYGGVILPIIFFIIGIFGMCFPETRSEIVSEFSRSLESMVGMTIACIVNFLFVVRFSQWIIYFQDVVKITHNGVYYRNFFKENLIEWEKIEDVRQTLFKICILVLKDKNILKKYIFFYLPRSLLEIFFPFLRKWGKEIDEICKFIKFKLLESRGVNC